MSKTYIVNFGYYRFGVEKKELAMELMEAIPLEKEYIKETASYIYIPKEEKDISLVIVDSSLIRSLTKEEKENKALASAESTASYYKGVAADRQKEIEELKCQLKVALTTKEA